MASVERTAAVEWHGNLAEGGGRVSLETGGIPSFEVSWPARSGEPGGKTSPEELISAAIGSCFAMKLSADLGRAGTPPERLSVSATTTLDLDQGAISRIRLRVRGHVPGADESAFTNAAEGAKSGCPVSQALAGVASIELDAHLEA